MKFLCDHMCFQVGKWLRAAGYDTLTAHSLMKDREIYQLAVKEKRILLTRDKDFKQIDPANKVVVYLKDFSLESNVKQLRKELGVNWQYKPFSRCLICNTPLNNIEDPGAVPEYVKNHFNSFWTCPTCVKVFWLGSHTKNMLEQLKKWDM